jgi:hypothetical protein
MKRWLMFVVVYSDEISETVKATSWHVLKAKYFMLLNDLAKRGCSCAAQRRGLRAKRVCGFRYHLREAKLRRLEVANTFLARSSASALSLEMVASGVTRYLDSALVAYKQTHHVYLTRTWNLQGEAAGMRREWAQASFAYRPGRR